MFGFERRFDILGSTLSLVNFNDATSRLLHWLWVAPQHSVLGRQCQRRTRGPGQWETGQFLRSSRTHTNRLRVPVIALLPVAEPELPRMSGLNSRILLCTACVPNT